MYGKIETILWSIFLIVSAIFAIKMYSLKNDYVNARLKKLKPRTVLEALKDLKGKCEYILSNDTLWYRLHLSK